MQSKTAKLIPAKNKIESVTVRRIVDDSPDTSYYGEYSNKRTSEFSIDRAHSLDCASVVPGAKAAQTILEHARGTVADLQALEPSADTLEWDALDTAYYLLDGLVDEVLDCDCGERGDMGRHEYRYFNPSLNYVDGSGELREGNTAEEVRKYVAQDYARMEDLNRGGWCFVGVKAEAEISIPAGSGYSTSQTIHSGGLWGIESDSGESCFAEAQADELANLRSQLSALGFSKRAIAMAFKPENITEKDS
jgi:hypothetical protein